MRKTITWVFAVIFGMIIFTVPSSALTKDGRFDGYKRSSIPIYNTDDLHDDLQNKQSKTAIPSSYDARTTGQLGEIHNQGNYGTCWTFEAMAGMEAAIRSKKLEGADETLDLSELQLAYGAYNFYGDPLGLAKGDAANIALKTKQNLFGRGGNDIVTLNTFSKGIQPALEEEVPYTDLAKEGDAYHMPDKYLYGNKHYRFTGGMFIYVSNVNRIKQEVMAKGAMGIAVHMPENREEKQLYRNADKTAYFLNVEKGANHGVALVGWDDNYAISNFGEVKPSKPGAWLIRNSWGDNNDEGGYFWVSYEDACLGATGHYAYSFEAAEYSKYDNIYQYDLSLANAYTGAKYSAMANIFTMKDNETLKAASFYAMQMHVNYEIKVYQLNANAVEPEDGVQLGKTVTGKLENMGYYTIDFEEHEGEAISIPAGTRYSVVVKLTDQNSNLVNMTYETSVYSTGLTEKISAAKGESFLKQGNEWKDCSELFGANIRLKALTKVNDNSVCEKIEIAQNSLTMRYGDMKELDWRSTPDFSSQTGVEWSSSDETVVRVLFGHLYAVGRGTATVTASKDGVSSKVNITVEKEDITSILIPEKVSIKRNKSLALETKLEPASATGYVSWKSSDEEKVAVDVNGVIYGLTATTEPVTITATSDTGVSATTMVTVEELQTIELADADVQSFHPYCPNVQTVEYKRPGAIGYEITFSDDTIVENTCDFILVYQGDGNLVGKYTGTNLSSKTLELSGESFKIVLEADSGGCGYGFKVTDIKTKYPQTAHPTATPMPTPVATPTPSTLPSVKTPVKVNIVKSMKFTKKLLRVKKGKKVNLNKYLKVTKNKSGKTKIKYKLLKKKYKKYILLTSAGTVKAKKKGVGKKVVVKAYAGDGSGKSAKITLKIRK